MVNYGRPSKDCAPCRRRKIRCDLIPTGCTQCRNAKLICYGYRSRNELVFRDETRHTIQRVLISRAATQLSYKLQISSDVSSQHAFLSLYINRYSASFSALGSLLTRSSTCGHLQASINAASLGFMSFQLNRPELVPLANRGYLTAIQYLGAAMRSSQQSTVNQLLNDETLQSVLLLDLYEKMAYHHYQTSDIPGSWLSHAQGALSILQSRPRSDFSNLATQQLATRTVIALTISCGVTGVPIPEGLRELYHDLDGLVQSAKWTFISLLMGLVNFRAEMRSGTLEISEILSRARELDNQFARAETKIPRDWWPRRVNARVLESFDCYYEIYPCHYTTQVFNAYRIMRLELSGVIRKFSPGTSVNETIAEITQAICAAVPQFMLPGVIPGNKLPLSPLQILECSGVLTPLYVAAQITTHTAMREWIKRSLLYMADQGVKLAHSVAHILSVQPEEDYWVIFKMVGSCATTA